MAAAEHKCRKGLRDIWLTNNELMRGMRVEKINCEARIENLTVKAVEKSTNIVENVMHGSFSEFCTIVRLIDSAGTDTQEAKNAAHN